MAIDQVYQIVLKSMISSIVPYCPKEILVEISKFINMIYTGKKPIDRVPSRSVSIF